MVSASSHCPPGATAVLVLADGSFIWGKGVGSTGTAVGEVCFNTSMTGYQEIMTDPSYAGQIVTFTFPHIGNVGANPSDVETGTPRARGLVLRADITGPSNWRATGSFNDWLAGNGLIGLAGIDTRRLTRLIRDSGAPTGVLCHQTEGEFDIESLRETAAAWPGLEGLDLASEVSCLQTHEWEGGLWRSHAGHRTDAGKHHHVVAVDYGAKHNILRSLHSAGCRVTVVPATASAEDVLRHRPDGIFLSNGPGDPAATGVYAVPVIRQLLKFRIPMFGICLGHQIMALALGAKTEKMHLGHRGANHPVQDLKTGRVEITSQNHGFVVTPESIPADVEITHKSLFDGTVEGLRCRNQPAFSVQYHPEASPGPQDSHYLFARFIGMLG